LVRVLVPADAIHGPNALGGPVLPEPDVGLDGRGAVELLRAVLADAAEPVVVLATGPLTNIALLLRLHPEVVSKIRQISWMGGSTARGNVTPYAEFNCWVDPEAAASVFASGVPVSMVGLNVTHQALATPAVMDRLSAVGTATAAFGVELLTFFRATYQRAEGMAAPPLHDPVAVALVAEPELVRTVHARVDVELHGTETAGATSVDLLGKLGRPPNALVAVDLDVPRFWAGLASAVGRMR
jgi:purine nucleosidase/pyrimidine-specific ribonucleoside hydrolase